MRVVESKMLKAMFHKKNLKCGNTEVTWWSGDICRVYLHGNMICEWIPEKRSLHVQDCGWQTVTTKSRLNAILRGFKVPVGIWQKNFNWHIGDDVWFGSREFTIYAHNDISV